jgi:hypothetical protein
MMKKIIFKKVLKIMKKKKNKIIIILILVHGIKKVMKNKIK